MSMEEVTSTLETIAEPDSVSIELRRGTKGDYGWTTKVRLSARQADGLLNGADMREAIDAIQRVDSDLREKYGEVANASH